MAGEVYNIGGGSRVSLASTLELIDAIAGRPLDVRHHERESGDVRDTGADIARAEEALGFAPATDLEAGPARRVRVGAALSLNGRSERDRDSELNSGALERRFGGYGSLRADDPPRQVSDRGGVARMASGGYSDSLEATRPMKRVPDRPPAPAPLPSRPVARAVKHAFDKLAAGIGLIVIAPVFLAVALALRFWGPGSVIRREERVGQDGRLVAVRSFAITGEMCRRSGAWRALTRAGVVALPQLWSVLKGELSLVGPRPRELGFSPPPTRPGLAGLAQLTQLERWLSIAEQLELDEMYARTWSLRLDARIIGRTVKRSLA